MKRCIDKGFIIVGILHLFFLIVLNLTNFLDTAVAAEREAIVFKRGGNLYVMNADGSGQKQLTKDSVGSFSVSRNGYIAFDRFDPLRFKAPLTDLNIYLITLKDGSIKKITSDGASINPVISPDAKTIAFQKFNWQGDGYKGFGRGVYLYDIKSNREKQFIGTITVPQDVIEVRSRGGQPVIIDESVWKRDNVIWSPQSDSFILQRTFENGWIISYFYDLTAEGEALPIPEEYTAMISDFDGQRILSFDNIKGLWIYDIKTGERTLIDYVNNGRFSPGGSHILFEKYIDKHVPHLLIYDIVRKKQINTGEKSYGYYRWGLDGNNILLQNDNKETLIFSLEKKKAKKLAAADVDSPEWTFISK